MRKLKRAIARGRMRAEGIQHMNRKYRGFNPLTGTPVTHPSYFATHWREYIN